jgi:acetamidase/formamidase
MKIILSVVCFFISCMVQAQITPAHITYIPASFSNSFSLNREPILKINSGDTISTETIDAGGYDKNEMKRQQGGNPLTGPFYINNTSPGDLIAVTITKLSLNRSTAFTTESFALRSMPKNIIRQMKKPRKVIWELDTLNGTAILNDTLYKHLQNFKIPLNPFLGCIGVAPSNKKNEVLSFFQGEYGGNLDFENITQTATIYLPVFHEGAYLYIGDGHAVQGHGEIAGNALETSLNVEFTVRVIKNQSASLSSPRVEDATYLMNFGIDKSIDDAVKKATYGLFSWLQNDYHISLQEASQIMSTCIEYFIPEIADPYVEVVAKIKKEFLNQLKKQE